MPLGSDYADQDCALARALAILGERWTLLIVRDAFHGLTRYDEFRRSLGLATNILSARLQKLVEHGVLERTGSRGSYHLTQKGHDLFPVVLTLMAWADRYERGPRGPRCRSCTPAAVTRREARCDASTAASPSRCATCAWFPRPVPSDRTASRPP